MTYSEFRRHLGKAGITINTFASIIGVLPSSVSNYAQKARVPTEYAVMVVLMGDAADRGVNFLDTLIKFGIKEQKSKELGNNISSLSDYRINALKIDK